MTEYEILLLLDPELAEDKQADVVARLRDLIEKGGGTFERHDVWGRRKLAYPIDKKEEGIYHLLSFTSSPETLDELSRVLKIEGAEFLSAYPTTPIIEAAAKADIRPVLCRQERVGVGIADGYARVTNGKRLAVFCMQYGPGAENAFPGVATAYSDSTPVLLLPLGHPRDRAQVFPLFNSARTYASVTKSVETLTVATQVVERPGVVSQHVAIAHAHASTIDHKDPACLEWFDRSVHGFCAAVHAEVGAARGQRVDQCIGTMFEIASRDRRSHGCGHHGAQVIVADAPGYGRALAAGIARAAGEFLLTMDADLSHPPSFVEALWRERHTADITIASRYVDGGAARMSGSRYALSRALNVLFSRGLDVPIRDLSSGFRLYRTAMLRELPLTSTDYDALQQILSDQTKARA